MPYPRKPRELESRIGSSPSVAGTLRSGICADAPPRASKPRYVASDSLQRCKVGTVNIPLGEVSKLRHLAAWYRSLAARAPRRRARDPRGQAARGRVPRTGGCAHRIRFHQPALNESRCEEINAVTIEPGLASARIDNLHPTQMTVGFHEVEEKIAELRKLFEGRTEADRLSAYQVPAFSGRTDTI